MLLSLSCFSYHVIMCIAFAYVFVSCIQAFSPLPVLHSGAPISSGAPLYLFSFVGVKHFRIGPRLVMRPWLLPVNRLSSFVPFGLRSILQRLTEGPRRPRLCCSPTPFQFGPKTHLNPLHHLERSITIAWPKTALHLEPPSSSYLYKDLSLKNSGSKTTLT